MPKLPKPKGSWKTTLTGIFGLTMSAAAIFHNPTLLIDPTTAPLVLGGIASSLGNIFAKDASSINKYMPTGADIEDGMDMAQKIKAIHDRRKAAN